MSIVIRSMKMPSKCIKCKLMRRCGKDDLDYVCMPARVYVEDLTNAYKPRPEYCPLVEIQPHSILTVWDSVFLRCMSALEELDIVSADREETE